MLLPIFARNNHAIFEERNFLIRIFRPLHCLKFVRATHKAFARIDDSAKTKCAGSSAPSARRTGKGVCRER